MLGLLKGLLAGRTNGRQNAAAKVGQMMVINFYGRIADRVGRSIELDLPHSITTVAELRRLLGTTYPDAAGEIASASLRPCIDDEIVGEAHDIRRAGTIEFFPPLSGG